MQQSSPPQLLSMTSHLFTAEAQLLVVLQHSVLHIHREIISINQFSHALLPHYTLTDEIGHHSICPKRCWEVGTQWNNDGKIGRWQESIENWN